MDTINKQWHEKHQIPHKAEREERVKWYLSHAKHCDCRVVPESIHQEIERRRKNKEISRQEHQSLAAWAADCAEHVLPFFEEKYPKDNRPRKAIEGCRTWVRTGDFKMSDVRGASLAAHAAAREAEDGSAARFAARAAGQAMATPHVPTHAFGAIYYGIKAADVADATGEREWQLRHLPKDLHSFL